MSLIQIEDIIKCRQMVHKKYIPSSLEFPTVSRSTGEALLEHINIGWILPIGSGPCIFMVAVNNLKMEPISLI